MWKKSKRLLFKVMIGKSCRSSTKETAKAGKQARHGRASRLKKAIASKEKHVSRQRSW
jgi:hypothetical protein